MKVEEALLIGVIRHLEDMKRYGFCQVEHCSRFAKREQNGIRCCAKHAYDIRKGRNLKLRPHKNPFV